MKKYSPKTLLISVLSVAMALFFVTRVSAVTPSLTLLSNGNNNLQVTVYADPNASVVLDYYSGGQLMGAGIIGFTSYNGYYSGTLNSYNYNIPTGAQVLVMVNSQQSNVTTWPVNSYNNGYNNNNCYQVYPYNCNNNNGYNTNGPVVLSVSNLNLTIGQSQTVTVTNGGYSYNSNQYYVTNNTNGAVTGNLSGNVLTIYGQNAGSGSLNVCANNGYGCASLYVTVTGNTYNNGNTCYQTYPYNCNTVCTYPYNYNCGNSNGYFNNNNPITVSNSNVQVTVGNSGVVTLYGGNSNTVYPYTNGNSGYYVTTSNSSVATATVNGSTLTIYGTTPGSTSVTVCSSNGGGQCASVSVTVMAPVYPYVYNGQYNYNGPYNYPSQPGNWQYSYNQNCWIRY